MCARDIMSAPLGISIIVVNYNNGRFLAAAIESALNQDYPLCEVIVVDDCSTDDSRAIIASYGDRIRPVLREVNEHQVVALNSAWPLAHHPILIFLDSDDLLFPHAARTIASVWTGAMVKAQFPLASIDKAGHRTGHVAPKYPPNLDTATLQAELLRTAGSPNSPASGNAYSRSLLDRINADGGFEIENPREHWMDAVLECNSPFYGEVATIYEPLASYRIHDSNLYAIATLDVMRFAAKCRTFELKVDYLAQRCRAWGIRFDPAAARNRSIWRLECRLVAAKLAEDPVSEPTFFILCRAIKACIAAQLPVVDRILRIVWFVSVAAAPPALAARLIAFRFIPGQRPKWFERVFTKVLGMARRLRILTAPVQGIAAGTRAGACRQRRSD
jgi:glycosyltransferase involved in cell wall biosynthesis